MSERAAFSPTGQTLPKRGFRERRALNRISHLGLLLPNGPLKGENRKKTVDVDGMRTAHKTVLRLTIAMPHEGDGVERNTGIEINRDPNNLFRLTSLSADSYIADDTADYYGIQPKHELFSLTNYDNELSIYEIADEMKLAVKAVNRYHALTRAVSPAYS